MTTIAAPSANQVQSTLTAAFTRGTSTTLVLTDGSLFPSPTPLGHVVYVHNADESKWCLVIYTSRATNTLTMGGGAADYALAKNVSIGDEAYEFPIGCVVELVCAADEIAQLFTEQADKIDADGSVPLTANWDVLDNDIRAQNLTADALTAGRVIFTGTDGLLTVDAKFSRNASGNFGFGIADAGNDRIMVNYNPEDDGAHGLSVVMTGVVTSNGLYNNRALTGSIKTNIDNGVTNSGSIRGLDFLAFHDSLGDIDDVYGIKISAGSSDAVATGDVINSYCVRSRRFYKAGTITNSYNIYLNSPVTGGTATNEWALYSADTADSYFAGNVGIGTTAPNQLLTVEGSISLKEQSAANADTSAYGQLWTKSNSPNILMYTDDAGNDFTVDVTAA